MNEYQSERLTLERGKIIAGPMTFGIVLDILKTLNEWSTQTRSLKERTLMNQHPESHVLIQQLQTTAFWALPLHFGGLLLQLLALAGKLGWFRPP